MDGINLVCEIFKIKSLKEYQMKAFKCLLNKNDCFVSQPTGSGKSIIFQALPLLKYCVDNCVKDITSDELLQSCNYISLVISPLNSLMHDQQTYLNSIGLSAIALTCEEKLSYNLQNTSENEAKDLINYRIIMMSPENLLSKYRYLLKEKQFSAQLVCIAIDESHCINKWGISSGQTVAFRSSYNSLAEIRSLLFHQVPIIALTATAVKQNRSVIISSLCMNKPMILSSIPTRDNIKFIVLDISKSRFIKIFMQPLLMDLEIEGYNSKKVLIFCRTVNDAAMIFSFFDNKMRSKYKDYTSRPYAMFHASTDQVVKDHVLKEFISSSGSVRVLIASIAFGMGVNVKSLNLIIHFGPPSGLDDYFQEAGRAGRDGSFSNAVLLKFSHCINTHTSSEVKNYVANETVCRKWLLTKVFDEEAVYRETERHHNCCDICELACKCCGDHCSYKRDEWWHRKISSTEEKRKQKTSIISHNLQLLLRADLLKLREKTLNATGVELLSRFPLIAIDQIVSIAHPNISEKEIAVNSSILDASVIPSIIQVITNLMSKSNIAASNLFKSEDDKMELSSESSGSSSDSSSDESEVDDNSDYSSSGSEL